MYCPFLSASYRRGDIRENLISAARGQRGASIPVRAVNPPRPCGSRRGFPPVNVVTRYAALPNFLPEGAFRRQRVVALSSERRSHPQSRLIGRALTPDGEAARSFILVEVSTSGA